MMPSSPPPSGAAGRLRLLVAVTALGCGALGARVWLDDARGDGRTEADAGALIDAPPARGRILDRNGVPLADSRPERHYPHGTLGAHLLGYLGEPSWLERPSLEKRGIDTSGVIGRHGVELAYERALHDGHDVVLTIDLDVQELAEAAVADHAAAAAVVVEVDTGRILALVSTPAFDPNVLSNELTPAEHARLQADPRHPYVDRTLQRHYPPASTFKLVTSIAGLEADATPDEVTCRGSRIVGKRTLLDMHAHGAVDFLGGLEQSCNIYFWEVAERVGVDRLTEVARDLGFGAPTGLGINGDVAGLLPAPTSPDEPPRDAHLRALYAGIGKGEVEVTVIQLAMAYAALASDGRLMEPQVVRQVIAPDGEVIIDARPILRRQIAASPATLALIRRGMWRVVNAPHGTAYGVRRGRVKMAGKTGTAQVRGVLDEERSAAPGGWDPTLAHAWFVGWGPVDDPAIVVAVLVEHGGVGGAVAAPVVRAIMDGTLRRAASAP